MSTVRLTTAEELLAMGKDRRELVRGEVIEMMPPGGVHGRVSLRVGRLLDEWSEAGGRGTVYVETGFFVERDPDTVRAPDVSFVRDGRLDGVNEWKYLPFAPDLAVEVVSPNDSFREVEERAAMWLRHGSGVVWVVEPDLRQVFVYRDGGPRRNLGLEEALTDEELLPGFSAPVSRLFT